MKLIGIGCILALVVYCSGYSFTIPANMGHPGICIYHGLFLKQGDNSLPSTCQNMHCNADGSILVEGCGHYDMRDCRIVDSIHLDKPYPDCCKMNFMCTTVNGNMINKEVSPLDSGSTKKVHYAQWSERAF